MRSIRWGVLALVAFVCVAHADINSWSARGPFGGRITDLVINPANPAIAYAADAVAVYKSADGGMTWTALTQDFGDTSIANLAFDPSNPAKLYVASLKRGVFRSTDGGTSFTLISAAPTDPNVDGPAALGISADGNTLYYSTISNNFYRSTDGGATFSQRTATPSTVEKLVVDPDNSAIIYGAFGTQLLKSTNGGDSWTVLPFPPLNGYATSVVLTPGTPKTLWLSTGEGVFSTPDDGVTWTPASTTLGTRVLQADASSPGALYASLRDQGGDIWRYSGGTWQQLAAVIPSIVNVLKVSPKNSQTILAATNNGIFRTTDGGGTWVRSNSGLDGTVVPVLTASSDHVYAGTYYGEMGIAATSMTLQGTVVLSGLNAIAQQLLISAIAIHPTNENIIIVGFDNGTGYRLSSDGGATWQPGSPLTGTASVNALAFDPSNPSLVYAAVNGPPDPIQLSTDGGLTFTPLVSNLTNIWATRLIVDPHKSSRLFLASQMYQATNGLFRSDDSGVTWTNLLPNATVFDTAIDPADSKRVYVANGNQVLISDDGGDTFTAVAALSPAVQGNPINIAVDPVFTDVVYVLAVLTLPNTGNPGTQEYFIMRSVDRGVSWERIPNSSVPNWEPLKLAIISAVPTMLFAATAGHSVQSFQIAPDLAISIQGHSGTIPIGLGASFDVKVQNTGPLAATGLVVNVTIPTGLQGVSASIPNGSCNLVGFGVQCSLHYLKLNDVATVHVSYTPPVGGPVNVQASVYEREHDPDSLNNTATATATATETVDLAVTGNPSAPNVQTGSAFTYTFQVRNTGPNASSATQLTIVPGSGIAVSSASPAGCTVANNAVNCDLGALASAAVVTVTVNASASAAGTFQTTATASHATTALDVNASNDVATVTVTATAPGGQGGGGGGGGSVSTEFLVGLALLVIESTRRRWWTSRQRTLVSLSVTGR